MSKDDQFKKNDKGFFAKVFDAVLPPVDDGTTNNEPAKVAAPQVVSTTSTVTPKKRIIPGSADTTVATEVASVVDNPLVEKFYGIIMKEVDKGGEAFTRFMNLVKSYQALIPGDEMKEIQAALIGMGENSKESVLEAIDQKLAIVSDSSKHFANEIVEKNAEITNDENSLPEKDKQIVLLNQQITTIQEAAQKQIEAKQKQIQALENQKAIITEKVKNGKADIASLKEAFAAALEKVQNEFAIIKSKIS